MNGSESGWGPGAGQVGVYLVRQSAGRVLPSWRVARSCSELLGAARSFSGLLGAARGCSGLLGAFRGCSELLGIARSCSRGRNLRVTGSCST